jgi:Leucine-rich repeat (LRR) protein
LPEALDSITYGSVFEVDERHQPVKFARTCQLTEGAALNRDKSLGLFLSKSSTSDLGWVSELVGFPVKIVIGRMTPDLIDALSDLRSLEAIWFYETNVSEELVNSIERNKSVRAIGFEKCSIEDEALVRLGALEQITELFVNQLCFDGVSLGECDFEVTRDCPANLNLALLKPVTALNSFNIHLTTTEGLDSFATDVSGKLFRLSMSFLECKSESLTAMLSPNLKHLDLTGCRGTEVTSLAALHKCTKLQSLLLRDSQIFSSFQEFQEELPHLSELNLGGLNLVADDVRWIWASRKMTKLDLSRNNFDEEIYHKLSDFEELRDLKLDGLKLKNIPANLNATSLKHLSVSQNPLGGADLEVLQRYCGLHSLDLSSCRLESLPPLQQFEELVELHLDASDFSAVDFKLVSTLTQLRQLSLGRCNVDVEALKSLSRLANLYALSLDCNELDCDAMFHLANLEYLEELDLSANHALSGKALRFLPQSIRTLNLESTGIQDDDLIHLFRFQGLDFLDLSDTAITDKGLEALSAHPTLRQLKIDACKISNKARSILSESRSLQSVSAHQTAIDAS